jgi:exodeoxyribonuclease-3
MKIATFNVDGVNARLPILLRWLEERRPDFAAPHRLARRLTASANDRWPS